MTGDTLYLTAAGWITDTLAVWKRNRAGAWEHAWADPHISRALIEAALREFPREGIAF